VQPDYARSTTSTTLAGLPAPIRDAIRARAEADLLTVADDAPAYITHSRRLKKPGLLARMTGSGDKDTEHYTAFVLGERDLLVCTHGEQRGTAVLVTRLENANVATIAPLTDGVSVSGFATSSSGVAAVGSYYIGLGAPEGEAARAALQDAIRAAKRA
jgi:hypothetical protein